MQREMQPGRRIKRQRNRYTNNQAGKQTVKQVFRHLNRQTEGMKRRDFKIQPKELGLKGFNHNIFVFILLDFYPRHRFGPTYRIQSKMMHVFLCF